MGFKGLIINTKQTDLLLGLKKDKPIRRIRKEAGYCTDAQAYTVIGFFEEKGLVTTEKEGRVRRATLTELGEKLYNLLVEVRFILS